MVPIRCPVCKGTMYYEDKGIDRKAENGFYCNKCSYVELDTALNDDMLQWQEKRKI